MIRFLQYLAIFLSSYILLFLSIAVTGFIECSSYRWWAFWLTAISFITLVYSLITIQNSFKESDSNQSGIEDIKVEKIRPIRGEMQNYTLPFLAGMMGLSFESVGAWISMLFLLVFIFALLYKEDLILFSPILILIGIKLYEIEYSEIGTKNTKKTKLVLSRQSNSTFREKNSLRVRKLRGYSIVLK